MKAIRVHQFGEPETLQIEDVPDPAPGAGHVVVRVHAVGVNPVDTYIRAGSYGRARPLPYTPGSDAAGVVEAVGAGVTPVKEGDRVYTASTVTGAYAEKTLVEASQVHRLPDGVTFEQGAAVNVPYATAWRALFQRGRAQPGETVLVHGASGGVGIAAVQIARAHGLTVIGTAGSEGGRRLVAEQGAHHVLDHGAQNYLETARMLTPQEKGFDIILEMLANVNLDRDLGALAPFGRILVIGSRGRIEIDPRAIMSRDAAILGVLLFNATPDEMQGIHAGIYAGLENGTLRPVVGKRLRLDEAPQAHRDIVGSTAQGKIVLIP